MEHMRICVIDTEINVLSMFYICHLWMVIKLFETKIVKTKRLRLIYCDFNIMKF